MITLSDLTRVSLRQVIRQRSFGVILSIALGITAFIALAVLGREIRYNIGQDMVLMGGVNVMQIIMDDSTHIGQPQREFNPDTVKAISELPGVATVSRNITGFEDFFFRQDASGFKVSFLGIDEHYWSTYAATIVAGRFLDEEDIEKRRRVCVLGWEIATNMFGSPQKALGQILTLGSDIFEVVGVAGGIMLGNGIRNGFIPYTTMQDRNWGGEKVGRLFVRAIAWEDVPNLSKIIPSIVLNLQEAPNLLIRTQEEQLNRIKTTFMFVEALLWLGIAASLMLGGFGIWYGTFAAVRARTREVGLKKAMGGSDRDILAQFLTEALCKSVAGGILGILLGTLCVEVGSFILGSAVSYSLLVLSSIGSIIFSAVIGIAGGMFPALQASRMDVVTALRFE